MHFALYKISLLFLFFFLFEGCIRTESNLAAIRIKNFNEDWEELQNLSPPIYDKALTLSEILVLVQDRNLDLIVKEKEYEYQYELATGAKLKMIPPLIITGEVSYRNRNTGSSSESLVPGIPPAPPSISSDQFVNRHDLTLTWNLLDFGISYFRARQAADKSVMQQMEYVRARQRLIQDTIEQYWKARTALLGLTKSRALLEEGTALMAFLNEQMDKQVISRDKTIFQERQLIKQAIQIQIFEKEYHAAMSELGKQMGFPYPNFTLVQDDVPPIELELPPPEVLERLALLNRPELYGLDMEEKNTIAEAKIALIQVLPSLAPFIGTYFDSNSFLIFHQWIYEGLRYSWNLLAIPYHLQDYFSEVEHRSVIEFERLAVSVGIMTQVNLAWLTYQDSMKEYRLIKKLSDMNQDLLNTTVMRERYGETSLANVFTDFRYDAFFAEVEAMRAYGFIQVAIAQINTSIGIPFYLSSENKCEAEDE